VIIVAVEAAAAAVSTPEGCNFSSMGIA